MDLSKLSVSNGSGEAVRALVTVLRAPGGTVITPNSLVNWPTNFVATTGPLLADGTLDPTKTIVFLGHISGSTIVIDQLAPGYTDTFGSAVGDVVVIKPNTWWADTLVNVTKQAYTDMTAFINSAGWVTPLTGTISSVTANGNRSYNLATSADNSALISAGMRGRTTRTVAAPTQSTSLNGTTQYWSKTTPAGMTFTDDFCAGAWVKLSSYPAGDSNIISRYNGTSGWQLYIYTTGQVALIGRNGASGNFSVVNSMQSLPLNKWVYVTAQLDMSTFTASSTTSYVMFDGVDVPAAVSRGGTNPTALVQAGNLEVGSANATGFFPGKIAQAFVSSAKITQANVRTLYSQGLTSALITANSIVSAYSFDGVATDLNTTNANNLTANGSALATNADSPFGGQAGGTISSTKDYFIVQSITSSAITVQVAEGCTIPTSGGVSSVSFSGVKAPYGFPAQRVKWDIEVIYGSTNLLQNTPTINTWYNLNAVITAPVGEWEKAYETSLYGGGSASSMVPQSTLSTSTSAVTDTRTSAEINSTGTTQVIGQVNRSADLSCSVQTPLYLLWRYIAGTITSGGFLTGDVPTVIRLKNAYL